MHLTQTQSRVRVDRIINQSKLSPRKLYSISLSRTASVYRCSPSSLPVHPLFHAAPRQSAAAPPLWHWRPWRPRRRLRRRGGLRPAHGQSRTVHPDGNYRTNQRTPRPFGLWPLIVPDNPTVKPYPPHPAPPQSTALCPEGIPEMKAGRWKRCK